MTSHPLTHAPPRLPTEDELRSYRDDGFLVVRGLVPDSVLDAAERGMERFYAGDVDRPFPGRTRYDHNDWSPEDGDVLRQNEYTSRMVQELAALVEWPGIAAFAAALAGTDSIRLWEDQLLYKPPTPPIADHVEAGSGNVGWHTDRQYWQGSTSTEMLTCWVPFHDCDAAMGGVAFLPASHRELVGGLSFFDRDLSAIDMSTTVVPELARGDVTFHHCGTVHGSGPNRTGRPRRSMAIHLQPADNRWAGGDDPVADAVYHRNNELVRTVDGHPDYSDPRICPVLWPRG